jgi:hypothetical protein
VLNVVLCDSLTIRRWSVDQPVPYCCSELARTCSHTSYCPSSIMEHRSVDVGTWERMNISVCEMHLQVDKNIVITYENHAPSLFSSVFKYERPES